MSETGVGALPYRLGVGIMLLNQHRDVFVARRLNSQAETWQMPQGGIDPDESPRQTARREMAEEIGTDKGDIVAESRDWYEYNLPEERISSTWQGRYRGQRQKWFVVKFTGVDADIDIATPNPEFVAWRWVTASRLPALVVPFKRPMYLRIIEEFRSYLGL